MSKLAKALSGAAGNAGADKLYVEDVFSTYVYTGNGSARSINNGIDLSGESGLVWIKNRTDALSHMLSDTARGAHKQLNTNTTNAQGTQSNILTAFNSNGFTIGTDGDVNTNAKEYASWSFRKAPKFFDIQTWSGNDSANRQLSHNLGSVPGMMIVKKTTGTYAWQIYHVSNGNTKFMEFGSFRVQTSSAVWNNTTPTDSVFTVGNEYGVNQSGSDYVAYLFASEAGGYGDDGTENIVKCGMFTGPDATTLTAVDLGFEPQFIMYKSITAGDNWRMHDNMRGWNVESRELLNPNTNAAESNLSNTSGYDLTPTATGFTHKGFYDSGAGVSSIYIAIRRPMKTPTAGTEVFMPDTRASSGGTLAEFISGFPVDMYLRYLLSASYENRAHTRLLGETKLITNTTAAEVADTTVSFASNVGAGPSGESANTSVLAHMFKRATGFMDVVAYSGNPSVAENHNLGVPPELIITKEYAQTWSWYSWGSVLGANKFVQLDVSASATNYTFNTTVTATTFMAGIASSGQPTIAYLFATLAGVSKVGSYTGTGSDLNVDCGFTGGARFILIKRTDATGDWYTYDSLRGIVAGNDPYLLLNSSAAEVTNTDYIDPLNAGFTVTSNASSTINVNGGTYIFLAIA